MKYSTVIFDLDGTLLNTPLDLQAAVNHILGNHGYEPRTLQQIIDATGNGPAELLARNLPRGKETPEFETIVREYRAYYEKHFCIKTVPYDGVVEVLRRLKEDGVKLAVVSNKNDPAVKSLCEKFFPGIPAFGEFPNVPRKPCPDMVFKAIELIGGDRNSCVYVGDSEVDVETGKNAKMRVVCVSWGFRTKEHLAECGAETIVDTAEELLKTIH